VFPVVVVLEVGVGRHNAILASKGVCNFASSLGWGGKNVNKIIFFVVKRVVWAVVC
jgi:hypothetical protein